METEIKTQPEKSAVPIAWVEAIFNRMEDRYGDLWAQRYGAFPRTRVMQTWSEDLVDLSRGELAHGVAASRELKFPPTLPEFRLLCRPALDYERAFIEAVEQLRLRDESRDTWSSVAVFWAAAKLGRDLQAFPYPSIKGRWKAALDEAIEGVRSGRLPAHVPQRLVALPKAGEVPVAPEVQAQRLETLREFGRKFGQREYVQPHAEARVMETQAGPELSATA